MTKLPPKAKTKTKLMALGRSPHDHFGFVNTPVFRGSTIVHSSVESLEKHLEYKYVYGRRGSPIRDDLEEAWSTLSDAKGTLITPSGLAGISLALLSCLKAGEHVLIPDNIYTPGRELCDGFLPRMGIEITYYDPLIGEGIEALIQPNTRVLYLESPGSLTFEVQDVPLMVNIAKKHGLFVVLDNTWATPLFFPAHQLGVDLVISSGSKYLGGHSDLLMGLVSANERAWPLLRAAYNFIGFTPTGEDLFLALRGLRTLELRLREAERQALALAHWLEARAEVSRVLHPALPSHPQHAIWRRDFTGSSGLFSVILYPFSTKAVHHMVDHLDLFGLGYSWGGFESLILPFDCSSSRTVNNWAPEGPAIRFQVGLEDIGDLIEDLDQGFARLKEV